MSAPCIDASELFAADRLLARAMEAVAWRKEPDGAITLDFDIWHRELEEMASEEGMPHVSCTLLVPNEVVPTYKSYGFLMNGNTAEIAHVADSESGASGRNDDFLANATDLTSLDELADLVRTTQPRVMNEVNAHFRTDDIVGLFAGKSRSGRPEVEALVAQNHLREGGLDLPLFVYDIERGQIEELIVAVEDLPAMIAAAFRPRAAEPYARAVGIDPADLPQQQTGLLAV